MADKQPDLSSWDDFTGDFLKCEHVKTFPFQIVPVNIDAEYSEGKAKVWIEFLYGNRNRKMGLNVTNQKVIQSSKLLPKDIIGKKLTIDKIKARKPTGEIVDSFLITKIEPTA